MNTIICNSRKQKKESVPKASWESRAEYAEAQRLRRGVIHILSLVTECAESCQGQLCLRVPSMNRGEWTIPAQPQRLCVLCASSITEFSEWAEMSRRWLKEIRIMSIIGLNGIHEWCLVRFDDMLALKRMMLIHFNLGPRMWPYREHEEKFVGKMKANYENSFLKRLLYL